MNRRTMLKGLGGVAVGLPLLEEMVAAARVHRAVGDGLAAYAGEALGELPGW